MQPESIKIHGVVANHEFFINVNTVKKRGDSGFSSVEKVDNVWSGDKAIPVGESKGWDPYTEDEEK